MKLTCARCGEYTELCNSVRSNDVQQPRICKSCLMHFMRTGDESVQYVYWLIQAIQSSDQKTIDHISKLIDNMKNP